MKAPRTRKQWQEAVDLAAGMRDIADLKMYGLLAGGPEINVARCDDMLERGRQRGITPSRPSEDIALQLIQVINSEANGGT